MLKAILSVSMILAITFGPAQADTTEISIKHNDLIRLANHQIGDDANPWQKIILILHGTLGHKDMEIISSQQAILAERGFSSLAINLSFNVDKRSGFYDCAQTHTHKHTDAITELGLWIDALKQRGTEDIWLMGHSRGSNQVTWYLSLHDEKAIKGLILIAPPAKDPKTFTKAFKKEGENLNDLLAKADKMSNDDTMTASLFLHCKNATVNAKTFIDYYKNDQRHDTITMLKSLNKPILIIAGTEDKALPNLPTKAKALSAAKSNISYAIIEGADHFFQDLYGEDIADEIETLINGE
jgi:pimeloyl-ACP methyl ester carboxylesterase